MSESEPHVIVFGSRRGRPPSTHPKGTPVTTWLPSDLADALYQLARRRSMNVSMLMRTIVADNLHRPRPR
jgi:hypothetical protein